MENEILYFLPSEIARLVLGYLLDEGYKSTYRSFLKECPNLKEYLSCVAQGHTYSLKINCMTLVEILEQYGRLKSGEIAKKIASPGMASLWKQFDNVVDLIKKQVTSTQFLYEGSIVQSSRTKQQMRHVQRNKILQSCVSALEKPSKSHGSCSVNIAEACSPVAGTSGAVSPCLEQNVNTNNSCPKTLVLEEDADQSDDNEPMDTCQVDDSEVASLLHDTPPNKPEVDSGKDGRDGVEGNAAQQTELNLATEDKQVTADKGIFVSTVVTSVPAITEEKSEDPQTQNVPPLSSSSVDNTAPSVPTLEQQSPVRQSSECGPVSATEERVPSVGLQTPVKQLQQTNTDSVTDKSPRRKRPPKRKSFGERRKSQPEKPGNCVQNESSSSTDGSLHDNMVPQIMNQLLSNPHLTHKLAKNINKSLHPDATPPPSPPIETRTFQDIGHTSLEDILDEHETQMTRSQIDSIISSTQSDPDLGELFGIFDLSLLSSGPRDQHNSMNSITPGSSQTALQAGTEPAYTEVTDTHRDLCTPRSFTPVEEVTRGRPVPSAPLFISRSPKPSQQPVKELSSHFTPINDSAYDPALASASVKSNQSLGSCSRKLDNSVTSPGLSSEHIPVTINSIVCTSVPRHIPKTTNSVVCTTVPRHIPKTKDSVVCTPEPGRNDPSVQHNVSGPFPSPKHVVTEHQSNRNHLVKSSAHSSVKISSSEGVQSKLQQSSAALTQAGVSDRINVAHTNTTCVASITNCVTAQPFATMFTSHQPIASQPSSQPVTTAVTSLQPITSAFSPEFGPMRMNVEASTHGFPVLSLTTTLQSDLDISDCVMQNKSSTENMSRRILSSDKHREHISKCSTAKKSVNNGLDDCVNNSYPMPQGKRQSSADTSELSTGVITTEASSVVQALATSADSLSTINIQSLYGTVDNTQQDTGKVASKGKKALKKKRTSAKNKSETSSRLSGWSSELSALVKITSPEKKTSETSSDKKTSKPTRTRSKSVEKLKEQQTYMAVLSPGGSTVQQIPVLEVDSLSEFGDAKDLIPVGTMVATSQLPKSDTPTRNESKRNTHSKTKKSSAKLRSPRISALTENMSEVCPALLTSSPRPNSTSTAVKSQNQQSGDQPSLLSMPTLNSLSSPCSLSTSLALPLMLSSQQAVSVSQSNVADTQSAVVMSPIPRIPQVKQVSSPAESTKDIKRTPEKILSAVYSADRDFLDSPQSVDYTELNESTGEDLAHKMFENAQRLQDKDEPIQECQKSYLGSSLEKQSGKELHVRSLNFGVIDGISSTAELSPVSGIGKLPSKSQLQQRIIFGLEVIQSGDSVRQLAYGRGHKNPNRTISGHSSPGVKKKTKSSSVKKRVTKSSSKGRQRTSATKTHTSSQDTLVDIDCQTDLSQDPVTHVVMDRQTFIKEKSKKPDKTMIIATTETEIDPSFNESKNAAIVDTDMAKNVNDTVNVKPIENQENSVEEPSDKEANVAIAQKNDALEDFIPDSSGKVYLSPAVSVVLTPEKLEGQGQMEQLSSVTNIKQPGSLVKPSEDNIGNCLGVGLKTIDIVSGNVGNKIQNMNILSKEKEISDSEYSSAGDEFVEATHSEGSVGSPSLHQKSDMDIFADTDDDSLLPGVTPPVVVSEISHDIAIIPSVFSDRKNKAKSKSILKHTSTAKGFAKETQTSYGTTQSICNQETTDNGICNDGNVNKEVNQPDVDGNRINRDNSLSSETFHKIKGDNYKSRHNLSRSNNKHQMTETLKQHTQYRQHKKVVHSGQSRMDNRLPGGSRIYTSNVDCRSSRQNNIAISDIDGREKSDVLQPHFNRAGSESSMEEEEDVDIMCDWDNPWQSGLTNAIVIENSPVQQERTIQHDFTGIQRTKRHDFIAENIEMHKSMNRNKKDPNNSSLQGSECTGHGHTDKVHHGVGEYLVQETGHDRENTHKGRMTFHNSRGRNQSPQITSSVNRSPRNDKTTTGDKIGNLNSIAHQPNSANGSNSDVQQSSNQRIPSALNLQGQQQSQVNPSRLRHISFKKYQPASVKVSYSAKGDEEDSYDLPDLSTPTKASGGRDNGVLGSGQSNRSSASRTSYQSDVTASLYQHVTPPKKRITASLKNGDSLYFFSSTQPTKPNRTKPEQPSGKPITALINNKISPQKAVQDNSKTTNSNSSPRRQRKATLTPRKELTTVDQGIPSKSKPAASSKREEATQTVMRRTKRQREENSDKEHKTPKKKTKKGKKLVDLSKLDVDKFLSKLYK